MEENIGLVVLEHLGNQLNVHVLNVDILTINSQPQTSNPIFE